jgi:hypothetical protein
MTTMKALEIWTAQTICGLGILLSVLSCLLHLGRTYFERIVSRITLRVAADLWWLAYIFLRDASLLFAMLLGVWGLNLDLMADIKIALPFVPLGTVAMATALAIKVFTASEERGHQLRVVNGWVSAGAALNLLGYVFVMEAPGEEYEAVRHPFWNLMRSMRSNANAELSVITFALAGVLFLCVVAFAIVLSRRGSPVPPEQEQAEHV